MRTIVGGRPRGDDDWGENLPRGIEVLLLKANVDTDFRELLGNDWRGAATSIGLELTDSEAAILDSVPGTVLADMSTRMRVGKIHHPIFRGKAAAAMLALLAGVSVTACSPPTPSPAPASTGVNEPSAWTGPKYITNIGIKSNTIHFVCDFASKDGVKQPGDVDKSAVNEPWDWSPPSTVCFGSLPEWHERNNDYESEDDLEK